MPQGWGGNAALQELNWVLSGIIFSLSDLVPGSILSELSDTTRLLYLAQSIPRRMELRAWERLGLFYFRGFAACAQVYVCAHAVGLCPSLRGGAPSGAGGSSPPCRVIRRGLWLGWGKFALTQATEVAAPRGRRISAGQLFAVPTERARAWEQAVRRLIHTPHPPYQGGEEPPGPVRTAPAERRAKPDSVSENKTRAKI